MGAGVIMAVTTLSSRELDLDVSRARKAAKDGPVFITDHGRPAHVLLSFEKYLCLTGGHQKIADLLAMPGIEDVELEIAPQRDFARTVDLS
jgi:prevent-host-death family protein